jgi:hypothetical protein
MIELAERSSRIATLVDRLRSRARERPDREAFVCPRAAPATSASFARTGSS